MPIMTMIVLDMVSSVPFSVMYVMYRGSVVDHLGVVLMVMMCHWYMSGSVVMNCGMMSLMVRFMVNWVAFVVSWGMVACSHDSSVLSS